MPTELQIENNKAYDRAYSAKRYLLIKEQKKIDRIARSTTSASPVNLTPVKLKKKRQLKMQGNEQDAWMLDTNMSPNSRILKNGIYQNLQKIFGQRLALLDNNLVIDSLTERIPNAGTLRGYIVVVKSIKLYFGLDVTELVDALALIKLRILEDTKKRMVAKSETVPKFTDLKKKLLLITEPRGYVINYLLLNYGVRNKDLDVFITKEDKIDDDKNYLYIINGKNVMYIVNDYKTQKSHGEKSFIIKDKKFIDMLNLLPIETHLLVNAKGEQVKLIQGVILKYTIDHTTESDIFRSIIEHIRKRKNFGKLLEFYSNARGSDVKSIMSNYNITTDSLHM